MDEEAGTAGEASVAGPAGLPATPPGGLSEAEARRRRAAGLGNASAVPRGSSWLRIVRRNVLTAINLILTAVSLTLVVFGLYVDALVTLGPVALNVGVSVGQEIRARRILDRVALLARPTAHLVRDGAEREAQVEELVLGDLIVVRAGDQVPVDSEVVSGRLQVDESLLTGESEWVVRGPGSSLLSGSVAGAGSATCRAVRVGPSSHVNRLLAEARRAREEATPLQREIGRATAAAAAVIVLGSIPVAASFARAGAELSAEPTLQAAAVLVALVPQGLLMMITLTYTLGAVRLARSGVVVQRLGAVEMMSRVDVLCLDKTGTLTTGAMELTTVEPIRGGSAAESVRPGEADERPGDPDGPVRAVLATYAASVSAANRTIEALRRALPGTRASVLDEVDFRSDRRWSALRWAPAPSREPRDPVTWVLGAPEVLQPCIADARARRAIAEHARRLARTGVRVLLLASGAGVPRDAAGEPRLPVPLEPAALVALREELRRDVRATLGGFRRARVRLRILSGDAPETVGAIARRAGVPRIGRLLLGTNLERSSDAELAEALSGGSVIGRVSPELKARVIGLLRGAGRFVAMVGDGVNDILALKRAQLGVAMGSGTPAARAVGDLVLMPDAFGLLPAAVLEGRRIVAGMRAVLCVLLARTGYMVVLVAASGLLGLPFPFSPRNNAVLALLTVGVPVILLALWVEPIRPPRGLLRSTARFTVPAAFAAAALCLPVYAAFLDRGVDAARTAVTTATVLCGLGLLTLLPRGATPAGERIGPVSSRIWLLVGAMAALYALTLGVGPLRGFFELVWIGWVETAIIAALAVGWTVALHLLRRPLSRAWVPVEGIAAAGVEGLAALRGRSSALGENDRPASPAQRYPDR